MLTISDHELAARWEISVEELRHAIQNQPSHRQQEIQNNVMPRSDGKLRFFVNSLTRLRNMLALELKLSPPPKPDHFLSATELERSGYTRTDHRVIKQKMEYMINTHGDDIARDANGVALKDENGEILRIRDVLFSYQSHIGSVIPGIDKNYAPAFVKNILDVTYISTSRLAEKWKVQRRILSRLIKKLCEQNPQFSQYAFYNKDRPIESGRISFHPQDIETIYNVVAKELRLDHPLKPDKFLSTGDVEKRPNIKFDHRKISKGMEYQRRVHGESIAFDSKGEPLRNEEGKILKIKDVIICYRNQSQGLMLAIDENYMETFRKEILEAKYYSVRELAEKWQISRWALHKTIENLCVNNKDFDQYAFHNRADSSKQKHISFHENDIPTIEAFIAEIYPLDLKPLPKNYLRPTNLADQSIVAKDCRGVVKKMQQVRDFFGAFPAFDEHGNALKKPDGSELKINEAIIDCRYSTTATMAIDARFVAGFASLAENSRTIKIIDLARQTNTPKELLEYYLRGLLAEEGTNFIISDKHPDEAGNAGHVYPIASHVALILDDLIRLNEAKKAGAMEIHPLARCHIDRRMEDHAQTGELAKILILGKELHEAERAAR